ncbi:MAG: MobQ family relaxase [Xanthobacteraceae bacterium]
MPAAAYYHCSVDSVSRAKGRSVVAAAAYRGGDKLVEESTGAVHDYRRRRGVLEAFIVLPAGAPAWAADRERLWNEANRADQRANGRLATELELALPHELNAEQRRRLAATFARELAERYRVAVDVALHMPGEGRDHRNHHAHMLVSQRELGPAGFGEVAHKHRVRKKIKGRYREVEVAGIAALTTDVARLRVQWANAVNAAYREGGLDLRTDHRSHRDRGLEVEPTQHLGPSAAEMERRGKGSERGDINREIAARNAERQRLKREADQVSAEIIDLAAERAKRRGGESKQKTEAAKPRRSPSEVLEQLTARQAVFTWRDLNRQLGKEIADPTARALATDEILRRAEIVGLRETAADPITHYTTRAVLDAERAVLRDAAALSAQAGHGVRAGRADQQASGLNAEQAAALRHATGGSGLAIIAGEAGTGKSRTLGAIREAYEADGYRVIGMSWTNSVVQDMRRDGFGNASTIAAEMKRLEHGTQSWTRKDVLIVDEAAMLATQHLAGVLSKARAAGAKVILAGDDRQLPSIERGGMFEPLRTTFGAAELHTVARVQDPDQQRAFNLMHDGKFREALDIFDGKGAINWSQTTDQAAESLQSRYAADIAAEPDRKRFIFAYTNDQVDVLNRFARDVHRQRGALGEDHALHVARGNAMFAAGDRVQFTDNGWSRREKEAGLVNGVVGTVVEIDTGMGKPRMTVELDTAQGEQPRRVSFVVGADREAGEFDAVRHGYAGTIYKGQGRTLDHTYVFHSHYWREASTYVALTRHRESVAIFAAHDTAADLDRLARQMGRDEIKRAAVSFIVDDERESAQAVDYDAGAKAQDPEQRAQITEQQPGDPARNAGRAHMSDTTVTEEEAKVARARREAAERDDRLAKEQADRLAEQPDELGFVYERLRSRQRRIDDYNAEQQRIAEAYRKRQAEQEAEVKEAEIRDARSRYAQALGDYDIRDPYGSLARASMAEYVSFRRDREQLSRQIAAETDPAKRRTLELRQDIELSDYMSITSHRIAGQSEYIVGRSNTDEAVRQRAQAKAYEERAKQLRAQYREHIAEQQLAKDEPEQTLEPEQTSEPDPSAPTPRQRGPRTARGRADWVVSPDGKVRAGDKQTEAEATDRAGAPERPRQRGDKTHERTDHPQRRGPGLER